MLSMISYHRIILKFLSKCRFVGLYIYCILLAALLKLVILLVLLLVHLGITNIEALTKRDALTSQGLKISFVVGETEIS